MRSGRAASDRSRGPSSISPTGRGRQTSGSPCAGARTPAEQGARRLIAIQVSRRRAPCSSVARKAPGGCRRGGEGACGGSARPRRVTDSQGVSARTGASIAHKATAGSREPAAARLRSAVVMPPVVVPPVAVMPMPAMVAPPAMPLPAVPVPAVATVPPVAMVAVTLAVVGRRHEPLLRGGGVRRDCRRRGCACRHAARKKYRETGCRC